MTKHALSIALALLACLTAAAQDGDLLEYQQEIGGGIGLSSYIGDAGGGFMTKPGIMGTFLWRRNLNQRMVVKTDAALAHIRGGSEGRFVPTDPLSHTAEGGTPAPAIRFGRNVVDLGVQFEFNFLPYGMGANYKGLSRWTPYLLAGIGATVGFGGGTDATGGMNIPLGAGFRYKLRPRLNLNVEWAIRFTTTDRLDDADAPTHLNAPLGIESGTFKNKDCYQLLFVGLTYDISPKYRKCNN